MPQTTETDVAGEHRRLAVVFRPLAHDNVVRIEESRQEVDRLFEELTAWLAGRRKRDTLGQYRTQLGALERVLADILVRIRDDLSAIGADEPGGGVYDRCRANDRRLVLARRFWTFFRDRFDQRDDATLGPLLAAADEVVWSCYSQGFVTTGAEPLSAPLPYVEPQQTPRALGRSTLPPELASDARDPVLRDALKLLPVPVVGIPSICVARPWLLVFLAHETGHQLQADLAGGSLRPGFAALLQRTVGAVGGEAAGTEEAWAGWSAEVFADAVSVLAIGASAARAMAELETSDDAGLLRGSPAYPPPIVRAAVMEGIVAAVSGPAGTHAPGEAAAAARPVVEGALERVEAAELAPDDEPLRAAAHARLAAVPAVVDAIVLERQGELQALPSICGWEFDHVRRVEQWRRDFAGAAKPFHEARRESARLATAGAYEAWLEVAAQGADDRAARGTVLRERIVETVPKCREANLRAAPAVPPLQLDAIAGSISDRLFADLGPEDE